MRTMKDLNGLLKNVFPGAEKYPHGILTPSIMDLGNSDCRVSLLLIDDKEVLDEMKSDDGKYEAEIITYLSERTGDDEKDLHFSIGFEVMGSIEKHMYEMVIKGDDRRFQKKFVSALKKADSIFLWIADTGLEVKRVICIGYNYDSDRNVLEAVAE